MSRLALLHLCDKMTNCEVQMLEIRDSILLSYLFGHTQNIMQSTMFTSALLAINGALAAPNLLRARQLQPPGGGPPGGGGGGAAGTTCSTTKAPTFTTPSAGTCLSLTSNVETTYPSVSDKRTVRMHRMLCSCQF